MRQRAPTASTPRPVGRRALLGLAAATVLGGAPASAPAQAASEEAAVLATVERLFDAMAKRDTAALRGVLTPEGRFASVVVMGDSVVPGGRSHASFIALVGAAPEPFIERMWDPRVFIAGPFAAVWAPYDFYRGETFSHCGTDVFTLVRVAGEWKINGASYTVVPEPCTSGRRATGTFEVGLTPREGDAPPTGIDGLSMEKRFHGDLDARSEGEMLARRDGETGTAVYVAIERVTGALEGRSGSFLLAHRGTISGEEQRLSVTVVPGSGTGQLAGLTGTMDIRIDGSEHHYAFEYTLPRGEGR